jgi:hypothetical protein
MYPTRASYNPFPENSLRYMCSTPQKHPAATVHFCAVSGTEAGVKAGVFRPKEVDVVKGRKRRLRKLGMLAMRTPARRNRMKVRGEGRLMIG